MSCVKQRSVLVVSFVVVTLVLAAAPPVEAQSKYGPLFDKFNFKVGGSWVAMSTEIRLDSEALGKGTTLSFEDDLNLGSDKTIPTVAFEWQIARKHKLGVRWQDITRASSAQALTEIQWGDEIIPIDANISLGFDITQTFLDYTYYPWVKERWAAGFGIGLRVMDFSVSLAWSEENVGEEASSDTSGTGPLPYLYFEYRRMFSDNWRFITGYGWLYIEMLIGRASTAPMVSPFWRPPWTWTSPMSLSLCGFVFRNLSPRSFENSNQKRGISCCQLSAISCQLCACCGVGNHCSAGRMPPSTRSELIEHGVLPKADS
ncbi:MAG: hypothetical protein JRF33_27800 [Deltaproteobacteria bacterium]|nr:hypothetical protein [Deltaproteobacteria bacterium]